MCSFTPPRILSACKAATPGDARDGAPPDPRKIIVKFRVNWGHASAQQIRRVLVDPEWDKSHLLQHVDGVLGHCEVRRAFGSAPHVPFAGTSAVSTFNEELYVDIFRMKSLRCMFWTSSASVRH